MGWEGHMKGTVYDLCEYGNEPSVTRGISCLAKGLSVSQEGLFHGLLLLLLLQQLLLLLLLPLLLQPLLPPPPLLLLQVVVANSISSNSINDGGGDSMYRVFITRCCGSQCTR